MKSKPCLAAAFSLLLAIFCASAVPLHAGTVEDIKAGSRKAAREIKEGAIETGKAAADVGKQIKKGSKKAWKKVKKGAKNAGKDFKKAIQETRDAIHKKSAGEEHKTRKDTD